MTVLVVIGVLVGLAALVASPFLLPWPQHLRWLVGAGALGDPWSSAPLVGLHEVNVVAVVSEPVGVVWLVHAIERTSEIVVLGSDRTCDLARLQRWEAAGTPLLKVVHPDGEISLHGPACSVAGLRDFSDVGVRAER
jgi:hypothetical protein